jgi:hypothetical protein
LTRVYVLRGRMSKRPSTPELREALGLLYSRAKVESVADPEWFLFDSMYMTGRLTRIDPTSVEQSFAQWAGVALLFSYSGLSFAISRRIAEVAKSTMREDRPGDLLTYHLMNFMRDYFEGSWDQPSGVSDELIELLMRAGRSFWDLDTFLGMDAYKQLDLGNFEAAQARLERICEIVDDYGYRFAETNRLAIPLFTAVAKRRLAEARETVERYLERPEETLNLIGLGNKAKIEVLLGDVGAAGETLAAAGKLLARIQRTTSPFHTGWYRTARLLHAVTRLEDPAVAGDAKQKKAALREAAVAAKEAARTASVLAMIRTETYRLTGTMHWLGGVPRKAVAWWEKAVAEGRRLGARPELARTHAEIARRLETHDGTVAAVARLSPAEHRDEARRLFQELGLDQDLASLGGTARARNVA